MSTNDMTYLSLCCKLKGSFIKDVINQGGGVAKRLSYLISLFSKSDYEWGRGSKISKRMMTSFINSPLSYFCHLLPQFEHIARIFLHWYSRLFKERAFSKFFTIWKFAYWIIINHLYHQVELSIRFRCRFCLMTLYTAFKHRLLVAFYIANT